MHSDMKRALEKNQPGQVAAELYLTQPEKYSINELRVLRGFFWANYYRVPDTKYHFDAINTEINDRAYRAASRQSFWLAAIAVLIAIAGLFKHS